MKESLIQITENISNADDVFHSNLGHIAARVHCNLDGNDSTYWFLVGNKSINTFGRPELARLGQFVPRNSNIATKILNEELGSEISYETTYLKVKKRIHHVVAHNKSDIESKTISLANVKQPYSYTDIHSFLQELRNKEREIAENLRKQQEQLRKIEELKAQENTAHERGVLRKGLNKLEEEHRILTMQQEEMNNLTKYIREQGKLRFRPIIDTVQNRIKTSHLYDGCTIVIDGGPGTGKTTTLIQRLKYLTDEYAIREDAENELNLYHLSNNQKEQLFDAMKADKDWMFFSPSQLLKEYLADAMNKEGLANTNAKVWYWDEFRRKIIRENYEFIDPTNDSAPFKACRINETLIYQNAGAIEELNNYFLNQLRSIKTKFPKIDDEKKNYLWKTIAMHIKESFDEADKYDLVAFVRLFASLENLYSFDCRGLLSENQSNIKSVVEELIVLINANEQLKGEIEKLVVNQPIEQGDDEGEMDDEERIEDMSGKISSMLRSWFKRYCYKMQNAEVKLTARQEQLSVLLEPILLDEHKAKMVKVGELALFEQYAKYARGVRSNLLVGFATIYKRFRRYLLNTKNTGWNLTLLTSLVTKREGKELHPQEQSLIIGFLNNLTKTIIRTTKANIKHTYIDAYKELSRPIIGVDEATDFCECDIYAMESLLSMDFCSMTICGDMMQRLTECGLTEWEQIEPLVPNMTLVAMRTSYRQSVSLLNVAKQLYLDTIGEEPEYKAHMKSTKVPKPLGYISADEQEKISWIEKRICEVYKAYGRRLPSIAIFLNDKNEIPQFVDRLKDTDFIYDAGIDVVDGSAGNVLASANQIRVYPISVVKGMEFDVVFFHNIDNSNESADLLKRYVYVGVSRAAFFLGITMNNDNSDMGKYLEIGSSWDKV